ncbi:MAG: hypothetical protein JW795_19540 [Chitinivibrionales bacterium]|nr:hypothetical protein [Chitinivibrionales bacterium]
MATINYAAREISIKVVYYGPGLSGKTTNLQIIHRKIPKESKTEMISLATETDRTLFFDFLPLDLGKIRGFTTKFQLYTVPGQVYYNATRKLVLRGVDGIVFVADSAAEKLNENLESFKNMEENLAEYKYQRELIPIIIQYNKQDLPSALPAQYLNTQLNKFNLQWNEAVASKGKGVFESLKLIGKLVIDQLNQRYAPQGSTPPRPQQPSAPVQKPLQDDLFIQPSKPQQTASPFAATASFTPQQLQQPQNPQQQFGKQQFTTNPPLQQPPFQPPLQQESQNTFQESRQAPYTYEHLEKNEVERQVDRYYTGATPQQPADIRNFNQNVQPAFDQTSLLIQPPQQQSKQPPFQGHGQPQNPPRQPQYPPQQQQYPGNTFNQQQQYPFNTQQAYTSGAEAVFNQTSQFELDNAAPKGFPQQPQNEFPFQQEQEQKGQHPRQQQFNEYRDFNPQQPTHQQDLGYEPPAQPGRPPYQQGPGAQQYNQPPQPQQQPQNQQQNADSFFEIDGFHYGQPQAQQSAPRQSPDTDDLDSDHDEDPNDDMFFSSVRGEKSKKRGKKPINPKLQMKQSFLRRLFKMLGVC